MKNILLLGSRKFFEEIEQYKTKIASEGISVLTPEKPQGELTPEQELDAKLKFWQRVKNADIVYIHTKDGYIGESGIAELAYSYACSKEIITSEEISPQTLNYKFHKELISRVLNLEQLIQYAKNNNRR